MRMIDADELIPKLNFILKAENQIYGRDSWGFVAKCIHAVEDAHTIEPEQRWIPCSERLPGIGQDILLTVKDDFTWIAEGCYRADDKWWQYRWNTVLEHNEVIAWMPWPEPYKENNHEDD